MIATYIRVFFALIAKEKISTVVNILGMSLAVACMVLVTYYLNYELTYDKHNELHKRIYRIANVMQFGSNVVTAPLSKRAVGPLMKQDYPQVVDYVRFEPLPTSLSLFSNGDIKNYENRVFLADASVFDVFSFGIISGDPSSALTAPLTIAISESFARRYFGGDLPEIGDTISSNLRDYSITLIYADQPENSHLKYDALVNYSLFNLPDNGEISQSERDALWYGFPQDYTYLLMSPGYEPENFNAISDSFYDRYMKYLEDTVGGKWSFYLEPLDEIHLSSTVEGDLPRGNYLYLIVLAAGALFVLSAAIVNYISLFLAQCSKRAREFGMKRLLGADKSLLRIQLLIESVMMALVSVVIGGVLAMLLSDVFNNLTGVHLTIHITPAVLFYLIAFGVCLGLTAGIYPAVAYPRISTIDALRQHQSKSFKDNRLKSGVIAVQFFVSALVLTCTLFLLQQIYYLGNTSLGFEKENKLVLPLHGADTIAGIESAIAAIRSLSGVNNVSATKDIPGRTISIDGRYVENNNGAFESVFTNFLTIDENFIDTLGIELLQGRNFREGSDADLFGALIVNEALVNEMGWEEPLGKRVDVFREEYARVIGVVKNFNFHTLHSQVEPMLLQLDPVRYAEIDSIRGNEFQQKYLLIDVNSDQISAVLQYLDSHWNEIDPDHPLSYWFLDESLNELYEQDADVVRLISIYSSICIIISCLGLFALVATNIAERTKEIGVRRILGASTFDVIGMLFRDLIPIIATSSAVAAIGSIWLALRWTQRYYYHADIQPLLLVIAVLTMACLAYITIAALVASVCKDNPVKSLKYE